MRSEIIILAIQVCLVCCAFRYQIPLVNSLASIEESFQTGDEFPVTTLGKGFMGSSSKIAVTYRKMKTVQGKDIHCFLGLQYGQDPSSNPDKRFKEAQMYSLTGTSLNATTYGSKCPQMKEGQFDKESSENCLTLNVYTNVPPNETTKGTIPVMVFSHGDSQLNGDSSMYRPDVLLDYNVILVTIQYRLGTFGFFSLDNKDAPGNAALADNILALNWVQNNINFLGGDKNKVTVVGHGQGALLFSSLLFYQVSQPLFHAAILHAGSALETLAVDTNPLDTAYKIAKKSNCSDGPLTQVSHVYKCMKELNVEEITKNLDALTREEKQAGRPGVMGTVLSNQTGNDILNKLVTDTPENIAKDPSKLRNVPVMIGVNKNEGSYYFGDIYWSLLADKYDDEKYLRDEMLADILKISGIPEPTKDLAELVKLDYIGDNDLANLNKSSIGLIDLSGGLFIKNPVWRTAQLMTSVNKSFFYAFDFESKDSLFNTYFGYQKQKPVFEHGVTHGDELMYLFNLPGDLEFDESQNTTRDRLATLWTNFAIHHDPTPDDDEDSWDDLDIPKWDAMGEDKNYLLIEDECQIENDFMKRRHIALQPTPLPTQDEYDFAEYQRGAFMGCMIFFILTTVGLAGFLGYIIFLKK